MPETKTYVSANGQFRLTVVPRKLESQLAYFEAKSRGEELAEPGGAFGQLEQFQGGKWTTLWSRALLNEVAPVDALVADNGRHVVTFDNWHSMGHGDHVIVIYGGGGALIRSLRLDQIVPAYFVDALPRSVSSIHWRSGEARFIGDMLEIGVSEPRDSPGEGGRFAVEIALTDGNVEAIALEKFAELRARVCASHADSVREFNEFLAFERSPLMYPAAADKNEWRRYLYNAIKRLRAITAQARDSESDRLDDIFGDEPFELLDAGAYMEKDFLETFRDALTAPGPELPRRWFASRDQERMVAEVERTAKKIKPGQLEGVEMRFFANGLHWPGILRALEKSGAQLVQIDTSVPIPPRTEDVAGLPPERVIDPACKAPN